MIEIKDLTKCYVKDTAVIDGINLTIKDGEFVTLLGPSGCGKTTILRMIGGFDSPTSGQILLDGKDICSIPANLRPINTVFQKYALFPHLNIYDNIAFGLKMKKMPKEQIKEKVSRALQIVDLEGFEERSVSTLSGGQQQRIAIARAIVNEPKILLLDEPLGALDYKMRAEMQLELKAMHENLGITFIFVTHDQEEAMTMSDRIVVLSEGKLQQVGTPEEIYKKPVNTFVADFIGETNIFNGTIPEKNKVNFLHHDFDCPNEYPAGMKIEAVVRPENVVLSKPEEGDLVAEVTSCIFKGNYYQVATEIGKAEIVANSLVNLEKGSKIGLQFPAEAIHLMPYNVSKNHFLGELQADGNISFPDMTVGVEGLVRSFPGSSFKDGKLIGKDGKIIAAEGSKISAFFDPHDGDLSDNPEEGMVRGKIISLIYKGDHYSYVVRSENEKDYHVDDDYLWNIEDYVSVIIPEEKLQYKINRR